MPEWWHDGRLDRKIAQLRRPVAEPEIEDPSMGAISNLNDALSRPGPAVPRRIFEIQGSRGRSPLIGEGVKTSGIVTALGRDGFYIQDPRGDGDSRTSDAVFVFLGKQPTVRIGDAVQVEGSVA